MLLNNRKYVLIRHVRLLSRLYGSPSVMNNLECTPQRAHLLQHMVSVSTDFYPTVDWWMAPLHRKERLTMTVANNNRTIFWICLLSVLNGFTTGIHIQASSVSVRSTKGMEPNWPLARVIHIHPGKDNLVWWLSKRPMEDLWVKWPSWSFLILFEHNLITCIISLVLLLSLSHETIVHAFFSLLV